MGYFVGFALCLFVMYFLTAEFLARSESALFNLSLLTSDMWAILAGTLLFGQRLSWLYFVSLVVTVSGLILYNSVPLDIPPAPHAQALAESPDGSASDERGERGERAAASRAADGTETAALGFESLRTEESDESTGSVERLGSAVGRESVGHGEGSVRLGGAGERSGLVSGGPGDGGSWGGEGVSSAFLDVRSSSDLVGEPARAAERSALLDLRSSRTSYSTDSLEPLVGGEALHTSRSSGGSTSRC